MPRQNNLTNISADRDLERANNIHALHILDSRFTKIIRSGHTTLLNSTLSDINDSGNVNWLMPDTATTLSIVSTSAEDGVAGDGIRTIMLMGLDQNFIEVTEIINLDGITPVTTVNSYRDMNLANGLIGGTPGSGAVGTITISATTGGQVFGKFLVNDTACETGRYTVPKGKKLIGTSIFVNPGKGADTTFHIEITIPGLMPISFGELFPSAGWVDYINISAVFLEAGQTIKLRGFYNSGGSGVRYMATQINGTLASVQTWESIKLN